MLNKAQPSRSPFSQHSPNPAQFCLTTHPGVCVYLGWLVLTSCDAVTQHRLEQSGPKLPKCTVCSSLFLKQKVIYGPKMEFNMAVTPFVILWTKSTQRNRGTSPGAILLGKTLNGTKSIPDSCHTVQGRRDRLGFASHSNESPTWCTRPSWGQGRTNLLFCS